MTTPNRSNYAEFVNVASQVARIQELQSESMSVKTRDFAFQTELKLRGSIASEVVKTDELIARNDSKTESSLAIEAAKAANKPKVTGQPSTGATGATSTATGASEAVLNGQVSGATSN
jgi:hypothetical protein